jgi:hypothetical protein
VRHGPHVCGLERVLTLTSRKGRALCQCHQATTPCYSEACSYSSEAKQFISICLPYHQWPSESIQGALLSLSRTMLLASRHRVVQSQSETRRVQPVHPRSSAFLAPRVWHALSFCPDSHPSLHIPFLYLYPRNSYLRQQRRKVLIEGTSTGATILIDLSVEGELEISSHTAMT